MWYFRLAIGGVTLLLIGTMVWQIVAPSGTSATRLFNYGKPTPIEAEGQAQGAYCRIQDEVSDLGWPIVERHVQHSAWTEYKIAAGRFHYRAVRELVLTPVAAEFAVSHSRAEFVAALAPLLTDEKRGGIAAAILAGLPARSKAALSYTTVLAEVVDRAQGGNPRAQPQWDEEARSASAPLGLYGVGNMGGRLERAAPRQRSGTLEHRLEKVLEERSKLPMTLFQPITIGPRSPFRGKRSALETVLGAYPIPEPDSRLNDFIAEFDRDEILMAIYPYVAAAKQGSKDLAILVWATGRQQSAWPVTQGQPVLDAASLAAVKAEITAAVRALCDESQAVEG
jgi:hypothetical protein